MTGQIHADIRFKPFDPDIHDRAAFSCGTDQIDNFLKLTAKKHQKGDYTRVWVAVGEDDKRIWGFYAINAHSIEVEEFPEKYQKKAPNHDSVPAAYISTFGVDRDFQGQGVGQILLADCLIKIAQISNEIGLHAVVLDVLDNGKADEVGRRKNFYERAGFQSFPSMPLRIFLPIQTIREVLPSG